MTVQFMIEFFRADERATYIIVKDEKVAERKAKSLQKKGDFDSYKITKVWSN